MNKKINPVTGKEIDPMFDGHLEKPLSKMTPKEKLEYLWKMTEFKWQIRNRINKGNYKNSEDFTSKSQSFKE